MKVLVTLAVLIVLISLGATQSCRADEQLTASELAVLLHVSVWITKIDLHGREFDVAVVHVVDGKIKNTLLIDTASPTDRPFERIVILSNQSPQGTKVSIQPGESGGSVAMSLTEPTETVPVYHTMGLPETVSEGDYLLGEGEVWMDPSPAGKHVQIKDVKEGLVFMLHPKGRLPKS